MGDVFSVAGCGFGEPLRRRRRWRMTERMVRRARRARVPAVMPRMALGERLWEGGGGGVREVESGGEGEGEGEGVEVGSGVDSGVGSGVGSGVDSGLEVARPKIRTSAAGVERVDAALGSGFGVASTKIRASPASVERAVSPTLVSEATVGTGSVTSVVAGANKSKGSVCIIRERADSEGVAVAGTAMILTLSTTTCVSSRDDAGEGSARIYTTEAVAALPAFALAPGVREVSNRQA